MRADIGDLSWHDGETPGRSKRKLGLPVARPVELDFSLEQFIAAGGYAVANEYPTARASAADDLLLVPGPVGEDLIGRGQLDFFGTFILALVLS